MTPVRVRFAPSPTGYLHVGGARTALFNWLFARKFHGVFILRIEDTDQKRSDKEMVHRILEGLTWMGLTWDEGPFFQADRLKSYRLAVDKLLENGKAYPCFCHPNELTEKRKTTWQYDGACREISSDKAKERVKHGDPYAVRLKAPDRGDVSFIDAVHKRVTVRHDQLDDFVIQRTNGMPIYHLACVVDDAAMQISHVIRGDDHLSNTPKQILLYRALDCSIPTFAHVPLILGEDKKRLSKRHGATSVEEYQTRGFSADAVRNFLALLGWSPGSDQELLEIDELISAFSLEGIGKAGAVFDIKKLEWLNAQYLLKKSLEELEPLVIESLKSGGYIDDLFAETHGEQIREFVNLIQPRLKMIDDAQKFAGYFFSDAFEYEPKAMKKHWKGDVRERLSAIIDMLEKCDHWTTDNLESSIRNLAKQLGVGAGKMIHPIRVALTGKMASPGLFEMMTFLGRETVLRRLKRAAEYLENAAHGSE